MSYIDDIAEIAYNYVVKRLDEEFEKEVSRAISVFQCRVSGVIQLLISFFSFNDTII